MPVQSHQMFTLDWGESKEKRDKRREREGSRRKRGSKGESPRERELSVFSGRIPEA